MQVLYGTGNPGKLAHMRRMLTGMDIQVISPAQAGIHVRVDENGKTPLENARLKAQKFFSVTGLCCLGCDTGLYLLGLAPREQPGVFVRRVAGRTLDDEAFIAHYSALARAQGGRLPARFYNGACLILPDGRSLETEGEEISTRVFEICDTPSPLRRPGYPMDSIARTPGGARYWVEEDEDQDETDVHVTEGFRTFFSRALALVREELLV